MKPNHSLRFEKLLVKGRWFYIISTAFLVAVLITAIQWYSKGQPDWRSVGLYAFLGAVIAQIDWLILSRRYRDFNDPSKFNPK